LNSDNKRILIADEVGLGKTIEAGHIMLELKARGEFHNALVVCPMALCSKWATELNEKFGLDFIEIEKKEMLIHELQHHNGGVLAVINYDKIRETSEILKVIEERNIKFSIIVCDESHKLRNNTTLIYHGAERLLQVSNSVVFMSATPIMIDEYNLKDTYLMGKTHSPEKIIPQADIMVLPSVSEGASIIALESMSCQRAFISTDTGNIKDVITHDENGIIVPAKDSKKLSEEIDRLISDERLREKLGINARESIMKNYSKIKIPYIEKEQ
jgi:hypothetical protein